MTAVSLEEEEVVAFVATQSRCSPNAITPRTTLLGDLCLDGYDAYEFVVAFMKRFSVDMSGYRCDRHFGPEGHYPWTPLYWLLLVWRAYTEKGSTPESRNRLIPVTVGDLIDSARAGRWSISYAAKG